MISIVMPVYNGERFIEDAVFSVINQTFTDWELIIVNDGSVDGTASLVENMFGTNSKIKLINQKNGGVSKARNVGIVTATGEYITFLDADDKLAPDFLDAVLNCLKKNNVDICAVGKEFGGGVYDYESCIKLCIEDSPLVGTCWGKLYKTQCLREKNILFPEGKSSHEDSYFVFNCFLNKMNMVTLDGELYLHNNVENSLSRSSFSEKNFCIIELAKQKYDLINYYFPKYKKISENILVKAYMALLVGLSSTKHYKKEEKESIFYIRKHKKSFIPASNFDKKWFFIIKCHLYKIFKIIKK